MDADYYLETIQVVFQDFSLVNGTWDVKGVDGKIERVRPQDIKTTALFSVEGELDDISGSGQTEAVHDICSGVPKSQQMHLEAKGAGHYGIFSGRRWREMVYPAVKAFILSHQPVAAKPAPQLSIRSPLRKLRKNHRVAPVKREDRSATKNVASQVHCAKSDHGHVSRPDPGGAAPDPVHALRLP